MATILTKTAGTWPAAFAFFGKYLIQSLRRDVVVSCGEIPTANGLKVTHLTAQKLVEVLHAIFHRALVGADF